MKKYKITVKVEEVSKNFLTDNSEVSLKEPMESNYNSSTIASDIIQNYLKNMKEKK